MYTKEQIWKEACLSTGDIALITGCGIIGPGFKLAFLFVQNGDSILNK